MVNKKSARLAVEHLPLALCIGLVGSMATDNFLMVIVGVVFGWLVDADHLIDYAIHLTKTSAVPTVDGFFSGEYFIESRKVYLLFHSFELVILIAVISQFTSGAITGYLICAAISLLAHLIQDQLTNRPNRWGYFIVYRFSTGFCQQRFCKQ